MDIRPDLDDALEAFGVPATVIRPVPDDEPIETTLIWPPPVRRRFSDEVYEVGVEIDRRQPERTMAAVPKADVPVLPLGTRIIAPAGAGQPLQTWRVELHEREHPDEWRVMVVPVDEDDAS